MGGLVVAIKIGIPPVASPLISQRCQVGFSYAHGPHLSGQLVRGWSSIAIAVTVARLLFGATSVAGTAAVSWWGRLSSGRHPGRHRYWLWRGCLRLRWRLSLRL
jgi:hypothetical protein